jgi:hypothetical protein
VFATMEEARSPTSDRHSRRRRGSCAASARPGWWTAPRRASTAR